VVQRYEIPAVVVGLNPTALGVVRSLTHHCARLVALESDRTEPGTRTRLATVRLVDDLCDHEALLAELVSLSRGFDERPVLFLSSDEHVLWAAENRAVLEHYYRLILPSRDLCQTFMFKDRFFALAARERWPVPDSAFVPTTELPRHLEAAGLRYPLILKATSKAGAWERHGLDNAYIVRDAGEAAAVAARAAHVVPALLAQRYVEGADSHVYFCLTFFSSALGEPLLFCGRKLLQWPPLRGSTAACEPALVPDLAEFSSRLFRRLGVQGFASLEVKYDGAGGFKIIEPTIGRVDLQSYLATLNGVNMPLAAYLAAIGCPDEARAFAHRTRSDVAWVEETSLWSLLRGHALAAFATATARRMRALVTF
jgi:D-aspartate ligase